MVQGEELSKFNGFRYQTNRAVRFLFEIAKNRNLAALQDIEMVHSSKKRLL